jgi:hypothetical protein
VAYPRGQPHRIRESAERLQRLYALSRQVQERIAMEQRILGGMELLRVLREKEAAEEARLRAEDSSFPESPAGLRAGAK